MWVDAEEFFTPDTKFTSKCAFVLNGAMASERNSMVSMSWSTKMCETQSIYCVFY